MPNNRRKTAFTLAEVLITLGIIGVVASLTMPALIQNYQKIQTVSQLKKAYSEISQAVKLSQIQNDELATWDFTLSGENFYNRYLKDYFVKNKEIKASEFKKQYTIYNLNNTQCSTEVWCTKNDSFFVYLANGSIMGIMTHDNQTKYKSITIDINGLKGPNKIGKDFFVFSIYAPDGLIPYGYKKGGIASQQIGNNIERKTVISNSDYACNKQHKGIWCSALIMIDGWQIADDYPW